MVTYIFGYLFYTAMTGMLVKAFMYILVYFISSFLFPILPTRGVKFFTLIVMLVCEVSIFSFEL